MVGTLGIGFLADPRTATKVAGLFYGGGAHQLWRQGVAGLAAGVFSFGMTWLIAMGLTKTIRLRVASQAEVSGIDLAEQSEVGYDLTRSSTRLTVVSGHADPRPRGRPQLDGPGGPPMKLVTAIVQPEKMEDVQRALIKHGNRGMTISEVSGYGHQGGHVEVYRAAEFTIDFILKVKIELLVDDEHCEEIMNVIVDAARTGQVGDGKVWAMPVDTVIRVRTGDRDLAAI